MKGQRIELHFPRLYRYDRTGEHCQISIPFPRGAFREEEMHLRIMDGEREMPGQSRVLSRHQDGSVRFLQVRFQADLPGMKEKKLQAEVARGKGTEVPGMILRTIPGPAGEDTPAGYRMEGGPGGLTFTLRQGSRHLLESLDDGRARYDGTQFFGPALRDKAGQEYLPEYGTWRVEEAGPLATVFRCEGKLRPTEGGQDAGGAPEPGREEKNTAPGRNPSFEVRLTAWFGKPWIEVAFRLINDREEALPVSSLVFAALSSPEAVYDARLAENSVRARGDSVGEGSVAKGKILQEDGIFETTGIGMLPRIEETMRDAPLRLCVGSSNYQTNFTISRGKSVQRVVDNARLMAEASEHYPEVFYGTFFTDRTTREDGICATVFQAQQNVPKAVKSDESGIYILLVPESGEEVVFEAGMSREQRFLLHFHAPEEPLASLDNRSLIYQMPDRPALDPEIYRDAEACLDLFVPRDRQIPEVEIALINRCDGHGRAYGMMNFGDAPDMNYTRQGRGKGMLVWSNNEYDFPHACALQYMRTGERRFLDYVIAAATHWMDVDVCHYSPDPLLQGGQWEHSRRHVLDSCMVCSHQWVEGLLDLYHLTGEDRALRTALGIGENVLRLLETPAYQVSGESNARETGWALRTLTALYTETWDRKWVARAEWIVSHFVQWQQEYGSWVAPYTDNTLIHVPFMIGVAIGSLYRYYRVFPSEQLKQLMLSAVDDLLESCMTEVGLFYYKELPSLNRLGNNTLLLEAMAIGFRLSGDEKYLRAGLPSFWRDIRSTGRSIGQKTLMEGVVMQSNESPKAFAQSMIPLTMFYRAATEAGLLQS